jgi:hypothetical protein
MVNTNKSRVYIPENNLVGSDRDEGARKLRLHSSKGHRHG